MKNTGWVWAVAFAVAVGVSGCGKESAGGGAYGAGGAMPPPTVRIMETALEQASPVTEYIAHVEPVQQVDLMAQVEGTIQEVHFREGSRVQAGDLLFTLDSSVYEATLAQREAELEQARATLDRAEKYLTMIQAADNRSVSKSDLDTAEASVAEGRAAVQRAEASVRQAEIDLDYTQIRSPIDGRIGRALITKGNLVSPSSGSLASVVQIDPIRVVLAMPDSEYLTAFEKYSSEQGYAPLIKVRLANGTVLPAEGEIDFDNNQMNPATGTMDIRLRFPNADRLLVPHAYVTILIEERDVPMSILVPVESVMHNAEGAFVWTVSDENTVTPTPVEPGTVMGARQIIRSGLGEGQRVVLAGMQNLRPGAAVTPIETAKSE